MRLPRTPGCVRSARRKVKNPITHGQQRSNKRRPRGSGQPSCPPAPRAPSPLTPSPPAGRKPRAKRCRRSPPPLPLQFGVRAGGPFSAPDSPSALSPPPTRRHLPAAPLAVPEPDGDGGLSDTLRPPPAGRSPGPGGASLPASARGRARPWDAFPRPRPRMATPGPPPLSGSAALPGGERFPGRTPPACVIRCRAARLLHPGSGRAAPRDAAAGRAGRGPGEQRGGLPAGEGRRGRPPAGLGVRVLPSPLPPRPGGPAPRSPRVRSLPASPPRLPASHPRRRSPSVRNGISPGPHPLRQNLHLR